MLPLPPLDGGRVLVAILPKVLAQQFAKLEPQGMVILLVFLFILPVIGQLMHMDFNLLQPLIFEGAQALRDPLAALTGFPA